MKIAPNLVVNTAYVYDLLSFLKDKIDEHMDDIYVVDSNISVPPASSDWIVVGSLSSSAQMLIGARYTSDTWAAGNKGTVISYVLHTALSPTGAWVVGVDSPQGTMFSGGGARPTLISGVTGMGSSGTDDYRLDLIEHNGAFIVLLDLNLSGSWVSHIAMTRFVPYSALETDPYVVIGGVPRYDAALLGTLGAVSPVLKPGNNAKPSHDGMIELDASHQPDGAGQYLLPELRIKTSTPGSQAPLGLLDPEVIRQAPEAFNSKQRLTDSNGVMWIIPADGARYAFRWLEGVAP